MTSPSISSYENGTIPPADRLRDYAILFASERWLAPDAPRRVFLDFLDPDERKIFSELNAELTTLSTQTASPAAAGSATAFWRFPPNEPVRIFCGRLDPEDAGRYGSGDDHNYMGLRNAADLDSLVELWGHIRRLNPDGDVRWILGSDFRSEDLTAHVVVLGNIARLQGAGKLLPDGTIPVQQVEVAGLDGEVFMVAGETYEPEIVGNRVTEDIGLIARVPNPHRAERSLTVCSGVFTRGVYGAVRAITDKEMREDNGAFLRERFGKASAFAMLMRVRVAGSAVVTPYLRDAANRLYEFSA